MQKQFDIVKAPDMRDLANQITSFEIGVQEVYNSFDHNKLDIVEFFEYIQVNIQLFLNKSQVLREQGDTASVDLVDVVVKRLNILLGKLAAEIT